MFLRANFYILFAGFLLDFIFGDPGFLYHPICAIGTAIAFLEKKIRAIFPKSQKGELCGGVLEVLLVLLLSFGIPFVALYFLAKWNTYLALLLEIFWCYQLLAGRCLASEGKKVQRALEEEDLDAGRLAVSMIVGRDTQELSEEGVIKATVETIAENTSDGVIAPMFYFMLGGIPLMFAYKAINTMDSMLGYKNDKYLYFGRAAAKLDDVANFIPARLSAFFMILGCMALRLRDSAIHPKTAWKMFQRDRNNHASPNSAQTESVMAGALQVQLAGNASYFGKLYKKPTIGDALRPIVAEDIQRAIKILMSTSITAVLFCVLIGAIGLVM